MAAMAVLEPCQSYSEVGEGGMGLTPEAIDQGSPLRSQTSVFQSLLQRAFNTKSTFIQSLIAKAGKTKRML